MTRFEGRVTMISGGGAGIGLATAVRIASEGGRVVLLDRSAEDLERAAKELGDRAACVQGDASLARDNDEAAHAALARWGRLDVFVANAGIRVYGSSLDATDEDWDRIIAVNLRGVSYGCAAAAKAMRTGGQGGAMVLISSQNAVLGRASMPLYDAAKAGVISLARSLAIELAADRIRVNSLCPGFTVTDFHVRNAERTGRTADDIRATKTGLLGRPAEASEMAAAIAFLASDDASFITATNLMVDAGGHSSGSF